MLIVKLIQQGDYIVSYCPELQLSSYGICEQEAKEAFEGLLSIVVKEENRYMGEPEYKIEYIVEKEVDFEKNMAQP